MPAALPPGTFRSAVLSLLCLTLLYGMLVAFQSDDRPWRDGALMWLPFLVASAPPYLFVLWRLSARADDPLALGLAAAVGVGSVLLLALFVIGMGSVREQPELNLLVGLLFFHVTLLAAVFLFVPTQLKLVRAALTELAALGPAGRGGLGRGVAALVGYVVVAGLFLTPLLAGASMVARRTDYSETAPRQHLQRLYKCLWQAAGPGAVNGFPASEEGLRALGPECWSPADAPGGSAYGTHYEFRYLPGTPDADGRIRSFGMATKKRNARGRYTESFYIDHLGIPRSSDTSWATAKTARIDSYQRSVVPSLLGMLDAYRERHGAYPARLLLDTAADSAGPGDLVIPPSGRYLAREVLPAPDGTTSLRTDFGRLDYTPRGAPLGQRAPAFTLALRAKGDGYLRSLRSYFIDEAGVIHGTGEDRDATAADPEAPASEWAPQAREQERENTLRRWTHGHFIGYTKVYW